MNRRDNPRHKHRRGPRRVVPPPELEAKRFIASLAGDSELACALTGGAFIENALGSLLQACMIDHPKVHSEQGGLLNDHRGILSGASARADVCFCLGLIESDIYSNAKSIARVRNLFAHSHKPIDFNDEDVKDECKKLKVWLAEPETAWNANPDALGVLSSGYVDTLQPLDKSKEELILDVPRKRFVLATCCTFFTIAYLVYTEPFWKNDKTMHLRARKRPVPYDGKWYLNLTRKDGKLFFDAVVLLEE